MSESGIYRVLSAAIAAGRACRATTIVGEVMTVCRVSAYGVTVTGRDGRVSVVPAWRMSRVWVA